jgi:hypothetical protein
LVALIVAAYMLYCTSGLSAVPSGEASYLEVNRLGRTIDRGDGRPLASHANPVCAISNSCPLMDMVD